MKRLLLTVVLAALPLAVLAQKGSVLREADPGDGPPIIGAPPDDGVTSVPLAPPGRYPRPVDQSDDDQDMVPNPLGSPNTVPVPGYRRQTQQEGQPQRGGWVPMGTATLQALDKVNARGDTMTVKVGGTGHFGSLDIAVRSCFVRAPDRPADATAFLVIRDQRAETPAFTGWMVRSAPYMSMMAHPIYDVRVTGCSP
jgi:hypothetical protein